MASAKSTRGGVARLAFELVLASFAGWLVVQNLLLLAMNPWPATSAALVVTAALLKVVGALFAMAWPWLVGIGLGAGVVGVVLLKRAPEAHREVRHAG